MNVFISSVAQSLLPTKKSYPSSEITIILTTKKYFHLITVSSFGNNELAQLPNICHTSKYVQNVSNP